MNQASIDRLQGAIFRQLGDDAEVFAPDADVSADRPVWTGRVIQLVDQSAETPGDGLSYEQKVQGFSFRASDAPSVPQGAIVRYDGRSFVVDEIASVEASTIRVTVEEQVVGEQGCRGAGRRGAGRRGAGLSRSRLSVSRSSRSMSVGRESLPLGCGDPCRNLPRS